MLNLGKNSKFSCADCGNNPVPHLVNWYFESLNVALYPIRQFVLAFSILKIFRKKKINQKIGLVFLKLSLFLRLISLQTEIEKCKVRRAYVLWQEARERGINMAEVLLFGKPMDVYVAEKKTLSPQQSGLNKKDFLLSFKSTIIFSGLPRPSFSSSAIVDLMDDKYLLKRKLLKAGLPAPKGGTAWNFIQAKKIFNHIQATSYQLPATGLPVIVKPRLGSRGRHSTLFIKNFDELKIAYNCAKKLCFWTVVEEQLFGPVYRATIINFELCGVLRGEAPQVVGDGVHGIRELIDLKNQAPHPGVKDIVMDEEMERFLRRQPFSSSPGHSVPSSWSRGEGRAGRGRTDDNREVLSFDCIPEIGETINLSGKVGVNYGGSSSEDYEICHMDNRKLFVDAALVLGEVIVGFDFIIPDITKSWREQKCGFIEANSLPFINLHHDPLLGKPKNVAKKVWDLMGW